MGIMEKVPVNFLQGTFFASGGYSQSPQETYLIWLNLRENRKEEQEWRKDARLTGRRKKNW